MKRFAIKEFTDEDLIRNLAQRLKFKGYGVRSGSVDGNYYIDVLAAGILWLINSYEKGTAKRYVLVYEETGEEVVVERNQVTGKIDAQDFFDLCYWGYLDNTR